MATGELGTGTDEGALFAPWCLTWYRVVSGTDVGTSDTGVGMRVPRAGVKTAQSHPYSLTLRP